MIDELHTCSKRHVKKFYFLYFGRGKLSWGEEKDGKEPRKREREREREREIFFFPSFFAFVF